MNALGCGIRLILGYTESELIQHVSESYVDIAILIRLQVIIVCVWYYPPETRSVSSFLTLTDLDCLSSFLTHPSTTLTCFTSCSHITCCTRASIFVGTIYATAAIHARVAGTFVNILKED